MRALFAGSLSEFGCLGKNEKNMKFKLHSMFQCTANHKENSFAEVFTNLARYKAENNFVGPSK